MLGLRDTGLSSSALLKLVASVRWDSAKLTKIDVSGNGTSFVSGASTADLDWEAVEALLNAVPSSCEVVHGWTDDEINPGAKEEEEEVVVEEEAEGETNTRQK
jgi:hypothetical protein